MIINILEEKYGKEIIAKNSKSKCKI